MPSAAIPGSLLRPYLPSRCQTRFIPTEFVQTVLKTRPLSTLCALQFLQKHDSRGLDGRFGKGVGQIRPFSQVGARVKASLLEVEEVAEDVRETTGGSIHIIMGPMFAGKTTQLLKSMSVEIAAGKRTALVKSNKDNRYSEIEVVSHDGVRLPCHSVPSLSAFRTALGEQAYTELEVIGVDEAQFFRDLESFAREAADRDGKMVYIAGLDADFRRQKFGSLVDLIPIANSVTKLSSRCQFCQAPAPFTLRKTAEVEQEVVGGSDRYMPVCRRHYLEAQAVMEVTRELTETKARVNGSDCQNESA